ncbi:MAG: hypothetical protein SOZ72_06890 [Treponema sp.]|nr:hypothetical protein [Treponema sp.]
MFFKVIGILVSIIVLYILITVIDFLFLLLIYKLDEDLLEDIDSAIIGIFLPLINFVLLVLLLLILIRYFICKLFSKKERRE